MTHPRLERGTTAGLLLLLLAALHPAAPARAASAPTGVFEGVIVDGLPRGEGHRESIPHRREVGSRRARTLEPAGNLVPDARGVEVVARVAPGHVNAGRQRGTALRADSVHWIIGHIEATLVEVAASPVEASLTGHVRSEEHRKALIEMYRRAAEHYRALLPTAP